MKKAHPEWTPAEWAFRWLYDKKEINLVLSGMNTQDQVDANIITAASHNPGQFTEEDREAIEKIRNQFLSVRAVPCTKCGYCQPCPMKVEIPRIFSIYNDFKMYENPEGAKGAYDWIPEGHRASKCTQCGECEGKCPQKISIINWLKIIDKDLS